MPKTTSGVTATKIKQQIKKYDKFILIATDGAIDSKWCNWGIRLRRCTKKFDLGENSIISNCSE